MTYPLRARFRTGATLAMFTLVVFTLVTGTATPGSFTAALDNVDEFGGGFQVRAGTSAGAPIVDMRAALRTAPGIRAADFPVVGSQSVLVGQGSTARPRSGRLRATWRAASTARSSSTRRSASARRPRGYSSAREVWNADRGAAGPGGRRRLDRAAPRQLRLRGAAGLPAQRLLRRGRRVRPGSDPGARSPDRSDAAADGHRRPQGRGAARDGRASPPRRRTSSARSRDGSSRRSTTSRSRRVSTLRTRRRNWNPHSSRAAWKPSRSRRSSTTPSPPASRSTASSRASWASG